MDMRIFQPGIHFFIQIRGKGSVIILMGLIQQKCVRVGAADNPAIVVGNIQQCLRNSDQHLIAKFFTV